MFNKEKFQEYLVNYKRDFVQKQWPEEKYKWEAVQNFQENWDIDAKDFPRMLEQSLAKTGNLLGSLNNYPRVMIQRFAQAAPENVRSMFSDLFDESMDLVERIEHFKAESKEFLEKENVEGRQHFQTENVISTYLWLRFPDKYYIYKFGEVKSVGEKLECDFSFKQGAYNDNLRNFMKLYDELCAEIQTDNELAELVKGKLTDACYPDQELRTLTIDVAFYISRYSAAAPEEEMEDAEEDTNYWWLNASPKIWSFSDIAVGETQDYTLYNDNNNKRRIFQNFLDAKVGDRVICYEPTPIKQIVALGRISTEQDGEKIFFEKTEGLVSPIDYSRLIECSELGGMEGFPNMQGTLFRLTKEEYNFILDMIREENPVVRDKVNKSYSKTDFLDEVFMTEDRYDELSALLKNKKNIILQGAPGVGKTFTAKRLAYSLMGAQDDDCVEFVQFHQNYSYEDFMMGYKPVEDGFELKKGIFYNFCRKAENQPSKDFFFIIDEINRGNLSKIFGELLVLVERDYRGTKIKLAYNGNGESFSVPKNLYIIGMMNTADRSLAMIDYALRRRFSFIEINPGFDSAGFIAYQNGLNDRTLNNLVAKVQDLNREISADPSLGTGFCIGHSYFCGQEVCTDEWLRSVVDFDILPMLSEYWFDEKAKRQKWESALHGAL